MEQSLDYEDQQLISVVTAQFNSAWQDCTPYWAPDFIYIVVLIDTSDLRLYWRGQRSEQNQNMSWWQCLPLKSERQNRFLASIQELYHISEVLHVESKHKAVRDEKLQNYHAVFGKNNFIYLPYLHQRKWIKCLFHLNLHLFWSAFFRINFHSFFLSVFVAVSSPLHSPSLLSLSQSWQSIFSLLLYHSHFGHLPKGRGKKKKMYYPPTGNWFWSFALKTLKKKDIAMRK